MVVLLLVYYMKQEGCGHESHDDSRQWRYSGPSMFNIAIICLDLLLIHTYNRSDPHLQRVSLGGLDKLEKSQAALFDNCSN